MGIWGWDEKLRKIKDGKCIKNSRDNFEDDFMFGFVWEFKFSGKVLCLIR